MRSTLTYLAYDYFWQFRLYACEKLTKWLETRRQTVLANNAAHITIVTGYAFRILVCLFSLLFHSKLTHKGARRIFLSDTPTSVNIFLNSSIFSLILSSDNTFHGEPIISLQLRKSLNVVNTELLGLVRKESVFYKALFLGSFYHVRCYIFI